MSDSPPIRGKTGSCKTCHEEDRRSFRAIAAPGLVDPHNSRNDVRDDVTPFDWTSHHDAFCDSRDGGRELVTFREWPESAIDNKNVIQTFASVVQKDGC